MLCLSLSSVIILLLASQDRANGINHDNDNICFNDKRTIVFSEKACMQIPPNEIPTFATDLEVRGAICNLKKEAFESLKCLKNVDLSFCNISEIEPHVFSTMKGLTVLKLSNNIIDLITDDIFSDLNQLEELFLDSNGIKVIMEGSLKNLESLKILDLANNKLLELPGELPSTLIKLNLMNNEIERISVEKLSNLIELEIFQLFGNDINTWPPGDFFPKLRKLTLGDKVVTSTDNSSNVQQIEILYLSAKKLNLPKINETLAEQIGSLTNLQSLYLENYEMSSFGFLDNLSKLTSLNLHSIYYTAQDIKIFPKNLKSLIINNSPDLTDKLLQTTHYFRRLTTLSLKNNKIKTIYGTQSEHLMMSFMYLDISSNPLNCNIESWSWLYKKIKDNTIFLNNSDNVKCYEPASARDRKLSDVLHLHTIMANYQPHEIKEFNDTSNFTANRQEDYDRTDKLYGILIFFSIVIPFFAILTCCYKVLSRFQTKSLSQTNANFVCSSEKAEIHLNRGKLSQFSKESENNAQRVQDNSPKTDSVIIDESHSIQNNHHVFDHKSM